VLGGQLSHRRKTALLTTLGVLLFAGGITAAVIELPNKSKSVDQGPISAPPSRQYKSAQAQRSRELSAEERHQLLSSVVLFVTTAVERSHPERSWPIVDPALREGLTRKQWQSGNIPVIPFPAASIGPVSVTSVVGTEALVEMVLIPTVRSHLVKKTFIMQLEEHSAQPPRWAVSSWMPAGISYSQPPQQHVSAAAMSHALRSDTLSPLWIIVPMGILLGGVLLLPAGVFARDAYRTRRAEADARNAHAD